ncbi:GroES chaperonin family [uncultured Caudovirales phage]|uniref:GroES chaperonin family n=1 Tax=uncultured Caudovirales phage TaxID=2100421 RepID=A0A6J7WH95_9CAUD|nr:GroES chaperonin family [uncultured Caudovirales phage]CAB5208927.1 GroES chaperonin family [uncultured Caudovirales phage]
MRAIASKLKPIRAHILVRDMNFGEQKSAGGIVLMSDDGKSEGVKPRWCKVYAVGPEQEDVKVGDWILVEHGRWTRGLIVEEDDGTDFSIWRVDPTGIMMVSETRPEGPEFGVFTSVAQSQSHRPEDFIQPR